MKKVSLAPKGFFEFTTPQEKKSDLDGWKNWFATKGIKTDIVQNKKGKFILCREGIDAHKQ